MKFAQLIVTAVFAFLGGMTFQLLDGVMSAQDKGDQGDVAHMKALKVDSLEVKQLRIYDSDWKSRKGAWDKDGVFVFGEDKAGASLGATGIFVTSKGEGGPSFNLIVLKEGVRVTLNGVNGECTGQWDNEALKLLGKDAWASLRPTVFMMASSGDDSPSFNVAVAKKDGVLVALKGTNGKDSVTLGANSGKKNMAYVNVHDSDGAIRAATGFNDKGKPVVATFDGSGKGVESIGGK